MKFFEVTSCLNCGSWKTLPSRFCRECGEMLLARMQAPKVIFLHRMEIKTLFLWPPQKTDALSSLVLEMKRADSSAWNYYARRFLERNELPPSNACFVSSESTGGGHHAQRWGAELSILTGNPHMTGLRPQQDRLRVQGQKSLSKKERQERRFEKNADFLRPEGPIIFVDDVVTTGATALAAYKALGEPKAFAVWSLVARGAS